MSDAFRSPTTDHSSDREQLRHTEMEKFSFSCKKKKTLLHRLTNKFLQQPSASKRDQSVQTSVLRSANRPSRQRTDSSNDQLTNTRRSRSLFRTFFVPHSPKSIPSIRRSRRRSVNLKAPKRLSSECLVSNHLRPFARVTTSSRSPFHSIAAGSIDSKDSNH